MAVIYDGNGTTFTRAGLTLKPHKITFGGSSREPIDVSTLSNSAAKTFVMGSLYMSNNITLNLEWDSSQRLAIISSGNLSTKITFKDTSYITVWCDVAEVGECEFSEDNKPNFDVVLKVTNLNGSNVETVPAFTAAAA